MRAASAVIRSPKLRGRIIRTLPARDERLDVTAHLDELRKRLISSLVVLTVGFGVAFAFHKRLVSALNEPLNGAQPVTLGVAEPFMTAVKLSVWAAFVVAFPVLAWNLWRYVAPSFDDGIRRAVATYVGFGTLLMFGGVAFGYFVALPSAIGFLTGFDSELYDVQLRAQEYYTFAAAVLVSVGAVFQLPVVLLALVRFRILTKERLRSNRRIAYVSLTALAVAMPGVDPVTTSMWLVPLGIMYEVSILLAGRVERRALRNAVEDPDDAVDAVA
ncbi:MAG: Sec-independent protein translocase, TatC subunit [Thermoleophilia bacterium]|nr:Sec-independent protein translocase, TatC subunit [Thermoleophilia bacterium]